MSASETTRIKISTHRVERLDAPAEKFDLD